MGLSCSISTFQKVMSWREPTEGAPGSVLWRHRLAGDRAGRGGGRAGARLETPKSLALPRARKATPEKGTRPGQGWQEAEGKRTPPRVTRQSWNPTQPPDSGLPESPSWHPRVGPQHPGGQQRPGAEVNCPPREGRLLTFARVSTTLTSGCFAGYFAMSHSKWVTKDGKSTGRNTFQQVSGVLPASGDQQGCQTPSQAAPLNPRKQSEKQGDRVGAPGKHMLPPTPGGALGQDRQQHPKPLGRTHQWPHLCPECAQTAAPKVCLGEILLPHEAEAGLGEIPRARLFPRLFWLCWPHSPVGLLFCSKGSQRHTRWPQANPKDHRARYGCHLLARGAELSFYRPHPSSGRGRFQKGILGAPGWLRPLSGRLLISAWVVISGASDRAPHWALCSTKSLSLPLLGSSPYSLSKK